MNFAISYMFALCIFVLLEETLILSNKPITSSKSSSKYHVFGIHCKILGSRVLNEEAPVDFDFQFERDQYQIRFR